MDDPKSTVLIQVTNNTKAWPLVSSAKLNIEGQMAKIKY